MFAALQHLGDIDHDGEGTITGNTAPLLHERIKRSLLLCRNAVSRCRRYPCHCLLLSTQRLLPLAVRRPDIRTAATCPLQSLGAPVLGGVAKLAQVRGLQTGL